MTKLERPVSAQAVAEYLGVTVETVRKLAKDKTNPIPHTIVGRQYRFRLSDIERHFYPQDDATTATQPSITGAQDE